MKPVTAGLAIVLLWVAPAFAQDPAWTADVTLASYVEAWELNDSVEHLHGLMAGTDRTVWSGVAIRAEGVLFYVRQAGDDTWLRGMTIAMRTRRRTRKLRLFLDVGCGVATAARRVPPTGTRSNYLLLLGGGVEVPIARAHLTAGPRWLHVSNAGREGRLQNPDIQSLGAFVGLGWTF